MKTLFFFIILFILVGCEQKGNNQTNKEKTFEEKVTLSNKADDISKIIQDSINSKLNVKGSFLNYQFGDSKSIVFAKTKNHLKSGKLVKETPYLGAQYKYLIYKLKLRESYVNFGVDFSFTNNNKLYKIELRTITPPLSTNSFLTLDFNEIVSLYKEKYKTLWHYNKYTPVTATVESVDYENVEGNRYICLNLFGGDITITYKNLTLEEKMKDDNLKTSKNDL